MFKSGQMFDHRMFDDRVDIDLVSDVMTAEGSPRPKVGVGGLADVPCSIQDMSPEELARPEVIAVGSKVAVYFQCQTLDSMLGGEMLNQKDRLRDRSRYGRVLVVVECKHERHQLYRVECKEVNQ